MTFPLSIPSGLKVKNSSFRLLRSITRSQSPLTFTQQFTKNQGAMWEGEVTLIPFTYAQAGALKSFLTKLEGQFGSFLYSDPDFLAKGLNGSNGGTPLVDGAGQTGNTLNVKGFDLSANGIWLEGDMIQLDAAADAELYMVTADVDSDGAGLAAVSIEPPLKSSPADSEVIVTTGAKGVFKLSDNAVEWQSNQSSIHQFTIAFREFVKV